MGKLSLRERIVMRYPMVMTTTNKIPAADTAGDLDASAFKSIMKGDDRSVIASDFDQTKCYKRENRVKRSKYFKKMMEAS
jgi:hypothetical protein